MRNGVKSVSKRSLTKGPRGAKHRSPAALSHHAPPPAPTALLRALRMRAALRPAARARAQRLCAPRQRPAALPACAHQRPKPASFAPNSPKNTGFSL